MKLHSVTLFLMSVMTLWSLGVNSDQAYRLGINDVVRVTVYGQPDLSTVARIAENGSVTLPVVGEVKLSGLTPREAERKLVDVFAQRNIVKAPQVGLFVEEFQSQLVSVVGEVSKPGVYAIKRGSTVMDLISEAGGLAEEAGDVAVVTRRDGPQGEKVIVDLTDVLEGRPGAGEPRIGDGDRIYVPKMDRFYVYGEVNEPGAYRFERGMTVMQALSLAGGLTDKGTERGMKIRRKTHEGGDEVVPTSLTQEIRPNDVIQVKESLF